MGIAKKFEQGLKKFLIGRWVQWPDKLIFYLSRKKSSGWVFGNRLRTWKYGKIKGVSNEQFIFIGCFPRSGSTLLTKIIRRHPEVGGPEAGRRESGNEIHVFQDIKTGFFLKNGFGLNKNGIGDLDKYKNDLVKFADRLAKKTKGNKKYILLKQPKHIYFIKSILKHFPNSKFIHLTRNGKDATMSQRYFLLPPGREEWPYEWCCRQWAVAINKGREFRNDPRYTEIKYEDLVENPYESSNKLFEFLNLKKLSNEKIKSLTGKKSKEDEDFAKPLNKNAVGKWGSKMSRKDKEIFNKIAGEEQKNLGYDA